MILREQEDVVLMWDAHLSRLKFQASRLAGQIIIGSSPTCKIRCSRPIGLLPSEDRNPGMKEGAATVGRQLAVFPALNKE